MDKWQCLACPYIYDPAKGDPGNGIPPGTPFEKLPDDWLCPECGVPKVYVFSASDSFKGLKLSCISDS